MFAERIVKRAGRMVKFLIVAFVSWILGVIGWVQIVGSIQNFKLNKKFLIETSAHSSVRRFFTRKAVSAFRDKKRYTVDRALGNTVVNTDGLMYNQSNIEGSVLDGQGEVDNAGIRGRVEVYDSGKSLSESTGNSRIYEANSEASEFGIHEGRSGENVYASDSEGREISETDFGRIKETAIKTENGQPIAVYHATPQMDFEKFEKSNDIGFHFGGVNQAKTRLEKKKLTMVELSGHI